MAEQLELDQAQAWEWLGATSPETALGEMARAGMGMGLRECLGNSNNGVH